MNAYDPNPLRGEPIAADDDIDSYNTPLPQITLITKCDAPISTCLSCGAFRISIRSRTSISACHLERTLYCIAVGVV